MSTLEMMLGDLDLVHNHAADGYWFEVLADGFDVGSPEAALAVIASLLRNGDDERVTRYGNRTASFRVAVRATDSAALHAGEAALAAQIGRRNTLSWQPPDGYAGATVFDVLTSTMSVEFDDLGLLRSPLELVYSITLRCLPFPRPTDLVTTALTINPTSGLAAVTVEGSMPTEGSLVLSGSNLRDVVVFSDPAMQATGYSPQLPATWNLAPEGTYEVWMASENYVTPGVDPDIVAGDIVVVTVTAGGKSQQIRTRAANVRSYIPVGEITLGGWRDGTVGTVTVSATVNGVSAANGTFRLFRKEPGVTSLLTAYPGVGVSEVRVDVPSLDFPQGGVWFDDTDGTALVDSLEWPTFQPGANSLFVSTFGTVSAANLDYYPRFHTFNAGAS